MVRALVAAVAALLIAGCATPPRGTPATAAAADARRPVTVLVSIDGFAPAYLGRGDTPRLDALARTGASGPMRPSFPSKTFPNHWTIVTGRRPDRHGIVGNRMEDPRRPGEVFTMATDDPFWWNDAAPIWVDAEKAGIRTATMFWPGANVAWGGTRAAAWPHRIVGGTRPRDWQQFNQAVTPVQRVNAVIDWMRRPAGIRPAFVTLYFDTVDTAGHEHGPDAPETADAVRQIDAAVGALVDALETLRQPANLVILSDHGMAAVDPARIIALDRIADPADFRLVESGPYASLEPAPGREAALASALAGPHDHMRCWPRAGIPAALAYGRHPRVPRFLCLAAVGWRIVPTAAAAFASRGDHGYDNHAPEMAALFIANGPAFRAGAALPLFDNVDVHPLLARLVDLPPRRTDGDPATLAAILAPAAPRAAKELTVSPSSD